MKQDAGRACQLFCVRQLGFWLQVGVDSVGVDEGQLGEGLLPAGGDLAFDETSFGFAFGAASEPAFLARSRARFVFDGAMASHSSLITSSLGSGPDSDSAEEAPLREAVLAALREPRETAPSDALERYDMPAGRRSHRRHLSQCLRQKRELK